MLHGNPYPSNIRVIENGQVWLIGCDAARLSASKVQKLAEHAALKELFTGSPWAVCILNCSLKWWMTKRKPLKPTASGNITSSF